MARLNINSSPWQTVCFHGDSFTVGLYASSEAATWRAQMSARLQALGGAATVVQQASTGAKMTGGSTASDAATVVSTYDPDLVFLAYGINDATGSGGSPATDAAFEAAARAVLAAYAGRRVQVQSIPWCNWGAGSEVVYARALRFNSILERAADDYGQYFVDVWMPTVYEDDVISRSWQTSSFSPGFAGDNFHYNDAGHRVIFQTHEAALKLIDSSIQRNAASGRGVASGRGSAGSRVAV